MIKSMTGFGRCELSDDYHKITVELKSVNHRYFDVNIKMPRKLNFFESAIRTLLKDYIQRGKVDVFIACEDLSQRDVQVRYNRAIAGEYLGYLREMAADFELEDDIRVSTLSRYPEVFSMEEAGIDENEKLKTDLTAKLNHMLVNVDRVEARAPELLEEYRKKLETKVAELLEDTQIEESRLSAEIVLYADKICTDEETVRLRAHIHSMLDTLESDEGIGRKLDFIAQEMNRESNTILSKANDLETSNLAIELKTEIEKVREQIQNIE